MRRRPPGPKGEPAFGNSRQYARDPFSFLDACADAYGDVIRLRFGPREVYALTNPDDIGRVLVSEAAKFRKLDFGDPAVHRLLGDGLLLSEGERWERQRRLANPAFAAGRVARLGETMVEYAEETVDGWADGDRIDVQSEMARLTVRIIASAMFGTEFDERRIRTVQESLEPLGARFEPDHRRPFVPSWAPTRENREFRRAVRTLEGVVDDVLEERRGTEEGESGESPPTDLLSILLRARERGEQTDANLRDELVTMLLAGHDTTALTLTYAFYLLSQHPEAEARLREEIDRVVGDGPPTTGDARRLDYAGRVLNETMRLYPPVYALFREPTLDVRLGGYRVPAGDGVMLPQWVVHRSPRWYDDPETFDPDRWLPERAADRPRFAFFPFGGGPRHCIGRQFSMLEATLVLATVARRRSLEYVGPEEFELRGSLTMHPRNPVTMRVRERRRGREEERESAGSSSR